MSILFFDGFDRCTATKDFDRNYWSFQPQIPQEYEKYAFGGYSYDHTQDAYGQYYSYYSPNNATLPTGQYHNDIYEYTGYGNQYVYKINSNSYPGFGSPYGFFSLHNIDITDIYNLVPITYIQLSGFQQPSTDNSFLSARFLGIETKDTTYSSNDKPGRFGSKHPLVAFCSGNITGLVINVVKVTGNHLSLIEDEKMTIGLEIEQNGISSGIFDLNLSEDIQDYQIRSVYSDISGSYSPAGGMQGRILTIARNDTEKQDVADLGKYWQPNFSSFWNYADHKVDSTAASISPNSRWVHFGVGILHSGSDTYVQIKIENVDALSIPLNDSITDKDLWDDKIYISRFNYDNIRFFNRTYNGDIEFRDYVLVSDDYPFTTRGDFSVESRYYQKGSLTLIDDVVLSDASGTPNYFPGANTKVIPFTPGLNGNITNNGVSEDGLTQWDVNSSSYRLAVKNLDGDTGKIYSAIPGDIMTVRHSNTNLIIPDSNSAWRGQLEDAVGGIKLYSSAKKEFLDSSYINVIYSGASDQYGEYVSLLLDVNDENNIYDKTRNYSLNNGNFINSENINTTGDINRFLDSSSIQFNDSYVGLDYLSLCPGNEPYNTYTFSTSTFYLRRNNSYPNPNYFFVIESWIYFTGDDPTYLCRKDNLLEYNTYLSKSFDIFCTREYLQYSTYVEDEMVSYRRLYFHETIPTGEWHHIAVNNDGIEETVPSTSYNNVPVYNNKYRLIAYLDGIANTGYEVYQPMHSGHISLHPFNNNYFFGLSTSDILWTNTTIYPNSVYFTKSAYTFENSTISNEDIDLVSDSKNSSLNNITSSYGSLTGSGISSSPATGNFTGFGNIKYIRLNLLTFESNYDGILHIDCRLVNYYSNIIIYQNDIPVVTTNNIFPDILGNTIGIYDNSSITGNYPINSGDIIRFTAYANDTNSNAALYINNIYLSQNGIVPGIYEFPIMGSRRVSDWVTSQYGNIGLFVDGFLEPNDNISFSGWHYDINPYPYFLGGNNIISNYRITQGTKRIVGQTTTRYPTPFTPPSIPFSVIEDDYIPLGDPINLVKTRYGKTNQKYFMENPVNNQPWNTGLIGNPSGFLLGVKKL